MDSHDRRRPSNAPTYPGQSVGAPPQSPYPPVSAAMRGGSSGRGSISQSYQYGNPSPYGELGSGSSMQYPPPGDYSGSSDPVQRGSQSQQSGHQQAQSAYSSMYSQQQPPASPYDSVSQYQPRQSAAIEVLSNQFAGAAPGYYVPGEGGPTSAPNSAVQQQYNTIPYGSQAPVGRDSIASAYSTSMPDAAQGQGSQAPYGQASGYGAQSAELEGAFNSYQEALRRTFESIRDGNLGEAGNTLVNISEWLLSNAELLGLVRDDESTHGDRLKLWNEFNTAWLSLLQRQRELSQEAGGNPSRLHPPQSLLEQEQMEDMGKELVRLCDNMEKHGLVDYQMGVWEEEIVTSLTACLDMLEEQPSGRSTGQRRR